MIKDEIEEFEKQYDLRLSYSWYLKDVSKRDFHYEKLFPTAKKLVYGCYSRFVDTDFVLSDKPDRVFCILRKERFQSDGKQNPLHKFNVENGFQVIGEGGDWETKDRLDGDYFEYETTIDKELTIMELLIKSDFVVRRSYDCQHYGFNSWKLDDDGVTLNIILDS